MNPEELVILVGQNLLIGLLNGGIYVVIGLGLTLLFGVSRIVNMAHGELFAIGGYLTLLAAIWLGINPVVVFVGTVVVAFALGWGLDRTLIAPLRVRPQVETPLEFFLILTMGLSLFFQNGLLAVFGPNYLETPVLVKGTALLPGDLTISYQRLLVLGATTAMVALLFLFLNRTKTGTAIRAASQDRAAAQAVGIDVQRLDSLVFGISAALAAAAGSLVTPIVYLYPAVGTSWMLGGIIVVIVGGLGSPVGTLIAGYGLGILEGMLVLLLPAQFKTIVGLLVMIVIMIFRPTGLMGKRPELEA